MRYTLLLFLSGLSFCFSSGQTDVKILTWNVFFTPGIAHSSQQAKRAPYIYNEIKKTDADVVVLEEMFHKKASRIVLDSLKSIYPYVTEKMPGGFFRVHGGVRILSKFPVDSVKQIAYRDKSGSDGLAKKGAVMVFLNINGKSLQLVGTHVQSGGYEKAVRVRKLQFSQLMRELLNPNLRPGVSQIICGDLNVDYYKIPEYLAMKDTLQTREFVMQGDPRFSWDGAQNDLGSRFFGTERQSLDYILLRDMSGNAKLVWEQILMPKAPENTKLKWKDLSDHYPVLCKIRLE